MLGLSKRLIAIALTASLLIELIPTLGTAQSLWISSGDLAFSREALTPAAEWAIDNFSRRSASGVRRGVEEIFFGPDKLPIWPADYKQTVPAHLKLKGPNQQTENEWLIFLNGADQFDLMRMGISNGGRRLLLHYRKTPYHNLDNLADRIFKSNRTQALQSIRQALITFWKEHPTEIDPRAPMRGMELTFLKDLFRTGDLPAFLESIFRHDLNVIKIRNKVISGLRSNPNFSLDDLRPIGLSETQIISLIGMMDRVTARTPWRELESLPENNSEEISHARALRREAWDNAARSVAPAAYENSLPATKKNPPKEPLEVKTPAATEITQPIFSYTIPQPFLDQLLPPSTETRDDLIIDVRTIRNSFYMWLKANQTEIDDAPKLLATLFEPTGSHPIDKNRYEIYANGHILAGGSRVFYKNKWTADQFVIRERTLHIQMEESRLRSLATGGWWDILGGTSGHELGHVTASVLIALPIAAVGGLFVFVARFIVSVIQTGRFRGHLRMLWQDYQEMTLSYWPSEITWIGSTAGVDIPGMAAGDDWQISHPFGILRRLLSIVVVAGALVTMPAVWISYRLFIEPHIVENSLPYTLLLLIISIMSVATVANTVTSFMRGWLEQDPRSDFYRVKYALGFKSLPPVGSVVLSLASRDPQESAFLVWLAQRNRLVEDATIGNGLSIEQVSDGAAQRAERQRLLDRFVAEGLMWVLRGRYHLSHSGIQLLDVFIQDIANASRKRQILIAPDVETGARWLDFLNNADKYDMIRVEFSDDVRNAILTDRQSPYKDLTDFSLRLEKKLNRTAIASTMTPTMLKISRALNDYQSTHPEPLEATSAMRPIEHLFLQDLLKRDQCLAFLDEVFLNKPLSSMQRKQFLHIIKSDHFQLIDLIHVSGDFPLAELTRLVVALDRVTERTPWADLEKLGRTNPQEAFDKRWEAWLKARENFDVSTPRYNSGRGTWRTQAARQGPKKRRPNGWTTAHFLTALLAGILPLLALPLASIKMAQAFTILGGLGFLLGTVSLNDIHAQIFSIILKSQSEDELIRRLGLPAEIAGRIFNLRLTKTKNPELVTSKVLFIKLNKAFPPEHPSLWRWMLALRSEIELAGASLARVAFQADVPMICVREITAGTWVPSLVRLMRLGITWTQGSPSDFFVNPYPLEYREAAALLPITLGVDFLRGLLTDPSYLNDARGNRLNGIDGHDLAQQIRLWIHSEFRNVHDMLALSSLFEPESNVFRWRHFEILVDGTPINATTLIKNPGVITIRVVTHPVRQEPKLLQAA